MITTSEEEVRGWFLGRLPREWALGPVEVTVDRDEVTVVVAVADPAAGSSEAETTGARAGRAAAFREDTREQRVRIAQEAEPRFGRKVTWGVTVGEGEGRHREVWSHVSVPVMTRLRQPQRLVLDTLVEAGVARSRSDALAWCVRLVGQHEEDWLAELREAMQHVTEVRGRGPAA